MNPRTTCLTLALAAGLVASAIPAAAQANRDDRESYSYLRTLDGPVTVAAPGSGPGEAAEANQPLLSGDEVRLARDARVEILLADRNVLRLEGGTALTLERVAYSADRQDRTTALSMAAGELLLVVTEDALGDELPEVRTPGATIYVHEPGVYRIEAAGDGWTELLVRDGYAELLTQRGSTVVRAGELARFQGDTWGRVRLVEAGPEDALERWGRDLQERAVVASRSVEYVEPELAYAAAPLADYGSWISVDASWYWRPRVAADWRPYWQGRWCSTPSGLTWVSSEPWGWVPYHYGTWMVVPGYGWAWRPGRTYSPAWVYWSWGDQWAGWCPVGYYTGYYSPWYNHGFRWGIYGWAGGGWGFYGDWNFVPTWCVRDRDWRPHHRTGHQLEREHRGQGPHGIITTDTRLITRDRLERPERIPVELAEHRRREAGGDAPDVTDFVARRKVLPPTVVRAIEERNDPGRLAGTPLAPDLPKGAIAVREPAARQPWRRGTDDAPVGGMPTRGVAGKDSPRTVEPGSRRDGQRAIEDDVPTRTLPSRPVTDGEPRALPRSTPRPESPAESGDPRQGWKSRREPGAGAAPATGGDGEPKTLPGRSSRFDDSPRPGRTPPTVDRKEPVQRVVGGVRRSPTSNPGTPKGDRSYEPRADDTPSTPRSYQTPSTPRTYSTPSTPRSYQTPSTPSTPRTYSTPSTPRTYTTPSTPRTYPTPSTPRTYSTPSTPRSYQTPSTPSAPRTYSTPSTPRSYQAPSTPRTYSTPSTPRSYQTPSTPSTPRTYSTPSTPRSGAGSGSSATPRASSSSGSSKSSPGSSSSSRPSKPSSPPPPRGGHS